MITPERSGHEPSAAAEAPADSSVPLSSRWQRLQAERARLDEQEQEVLRAALTMSGGVVAKAAREVGIARTTLASRLDALGIRSPRGE